MTQATIFVLTLIVFSAAQPLAAVPHPEASSPSTAALENDIIEATLRSQMRRLADERGRRVFYLARGSAEPSAPSEAFMNRFVSSAPRVRRFARDGFDLAQLKRRGGVVIGTYRVRQVGAAAYQVEGYYFVAPGEAEGYVCAVERKQAGEWMVTGCQGTWVV